MKAGDKLRVKELEIDRASTEAGIFEYKLCNKSRGGTVPYSLDRE